MEFWQKKKIGVLLNLFLINNGCISNDFIGIENKDNLICNEQELVELFNEYYINIVEKPPGKKLLPL